MTNTELIIKNTIIVPTTQLKIHFPFRIVIPGGPCSSDPCNSNGVCVRLAETYECFCANGFNGQNCEIALEPCAMHSCQDGSTCVETGDGENNYECQCSDEFTGEFCEHRIGMCSTQPKSIFYYSSTLNASLI